MLQVTLSGGTDRADVPLRPEEMDAAAHFVRNQGYSLERFGLQPVGHSNYAAWPVPADQILPEPVPAVSPESGGKCEPALKSTLGASVDLLVELPVEPPVGPAVGPAVEPVVGLAVKPVVELAAKPVAEPAVEREPPKPEQAAAPDAQTKPHTIVWKSFPKPRS